MRVFSAPPKAYPDHPAELEVLDLLREVHDVAQPELDDDPDADDEDDDEEALPLVSMPGDQPNTVSSMPRLPADGIDLKVHLANMEQSLIRQALDEANGVVAHAAKKLKMRRTTLVEKLRKYGLQRGQELTGL